MLKKNFYLTLIFLVALLNVSCLYAQEEKNTVSTTFVEIENVSDLYKKANEIEDENSALENKIKDLIQTVELDKELTVLKDNLHQLRHKYEESKIAENTEIESIISLRGNVKKLSSDCDELTKNIVEKVKSLELCQKYWESKKDFWAQVQKQSNFVNNKTAKDIFNDTDKIIEASLKQFENVDEPFVALQQKANEVSRDIEKLIASLDNFVTLLRSRLFKKTGNSLLSSKYFSEYDAKLKNDFLTGIVSASNFDVNFIKNNVVALILQLVFIIGFAVFFKLVKSESVKSFGLGFLHENFIASGLFLGIIISSLFLDGCSTNVKFFYTLIISICAAILVCSKLSGKCNKASIIIVFGLFIITKLSELISLPITLSRFVIAIVSLAAGIYFFKSGSLIKEKQENGDYKAPSLKEKLIDKILSLFFFAAFICQIAGYAALASHIFNVTIRSILLGLFIFILLGGIKGIVSLIFTSNLVLKSSKFIELNKDLIIRRFNTILTAIVIFIGFSAMLSIWDVYDNTWHAVSSIMAIGFVLHGVKITIGSFVWASFLFYLILCVSWTLRCILETEFYPSQKIEKGVGISINRLIYYCFIVVAILVAMGILGISLQSLTVIIGALGVGIGFGLQNIVNNFASGLILLFERSIKVGDKVVVGGTWGTVKHLGLRATVIETFANAEMIVPNSDLVSSTVNNWTMTNRKTRFSINVGVAYGTDPVKVKDILLEIAKAHKNVLSDPAPAVVFAEFGDSSLNFELRCWVKDIDVHWSTQNDLMYDIDKKFKEHKIEIPFPQRDLYIKSMPEVVVNKK